MVHYKLTYFDARALGEVTRQLFHLAGVDFEDNRISIDEFMKIKSSLPAGQLPILEVDGTVISQSAAIGRYLAREFGYAGKTPMEEAQADSAVDLFKDFIVVSFRQLGFALLSGKPEEETEKIKKEVVKPATDVYFTALNKILDKSTSGFLAGDEMTWADLQIADNLTSLRNVGLFEATEQPRLETFYQKVLANEKLKAYLEKRPFNLI